MTPEEKIERLENELSELKVLVFAVLKTDKLVFEKDIVISAENGIKIGGTTTQKLAFWNATPVSQQASIADADGTLADATTKINSILDVLDNLGITA